MPFIGYLNFLTPTVDIWVQL